MLIVAMVLSFSLAWGQAATAGIDAKAIDATKGSIVRDIDPRLPRVPLAQWLAKLVPGVEAKWEVNDCGEQTGDPQVDRGRDFPMCVQAELTLGKRRHLRLLFGVGPFKKGLTPGPPEFGYGTMMEDGRTTRWITKLGDIPAALQPGRQQRPDALPKQRVIARQRSRARRQALRRAARLHGGLGGSA